MTYFALLCLAIGLSMDAFSVAICKGLSTTQLKPIHYMKIGLWFGGFQALMPTLGYFLAGSFAQYVNQFAHYIAFVLLAFIGYNMVHNGLCPEETPKDNSFGTKSMFLLAVATSIDALAVGVTFALLPNIHLPLAVTTIGITTCLCSMVGLKIGNAFGRAYQSKAELFGGVILILLGFKILLEHLGCWPI